MQTPPHSIEAEQSVLGALLIDPISLMKISDFLKPDDFYLTAHADVYGAMLELSHARKPIDLVTLQTLLKEKNILEAMGGIAFLVELTSIVPSAINILEYANIVKTKSTLRKMISAGQRIAGYGSQEDKPLEELLEKSEKEVFSISQTFLKNKFVSIKEILSERFEVFSDRYDSGDEAVETGVMSGFKGIDELLGGFQPSDLVILAARPSMGKTGLALAIGLNAAQHYKKTIGVFSLEMAKEQLVDRMFSNLLRVDLWKLQKGKLSDEEFMRMGPTMDELSQLPIFIDDTVDSSIAALRAKSRRLQMEHGLDMIIIDYLQLMSTGNAQMALNRVNEISEISRSLKALARELHVPIIALSQLSRGVEARTDKRPVMSDLRDSGAIEQDADVIMMIYRDEYYNGPDEENRDVTEIHVRKHRNGPVGECKLRFDRAQMRFFDIDTQHSF